MALEHSEDDASHGATTCRAAGADRLCRGDAAPGRQAERDHGRRPGLTTEERARFKHEARSSTAVRMHGRVHRHPPGELWMRADQCGAADRPVVVLRPRGRPTINTRRAARAAATPGWPSTSAGCGESIGRCTGSERSGSSAARGAGRGPRHGQWVAWYNKGRLLEPLGYVPPAEFEQAYQDRQTAPAGLADLT